MGTFDAVISLAELNGSDGVVLNGSLATGRAGRTVAGIGDYNGDGFEDFIIGAPETNVGTSLTGTVYIVFGNRFGSQPVFQLSALDGTNGFLVNGIRSVFERFGTTLSSAGDFNGDGYADFVVGTRSGDFGGYNSGASYVIFGRPDMTTGSFDLTTLDGSNGFRIDGEAENDLAGGPLASAGDINGDGFDDLVIGATGVDVGGNSNAGSAYILFGKAGGFSPDMSLGALDGTNGFRINGTGAYSVMGGWVSRAGDVNGDGLDDFMVSGSESVYVVYGKTGSFPATLDMASLNGKNGFRVEGPTNALALRVAHSVGDVNGDGFDDLSFYNSGTGNSTVLFGKVTTETATVSLNGINGGNGFSLGSTLRWVIAAGDVNGDGVDDMIAGNPNFFPSNPLAPTGAAYVIFGKKGGFGASVDVSKLDGTDGFRLEGVGVADSTGESFNAAGDLNGDGFDDIIVGAPSADPGGEQNAGAAYILYGKASNGTARNDVLTGTAKANGFAGAGGDDTMSGLGGNDTLSGGEGNDRIFGGDGSDAISGSAGGDSLDGGAGNDTLSAGDGNDSIAGFGGNDVLAGGAGADTLDGGSGADRMFGGAGNDIYLIDETGDSVTDSGGTDRVQSGTIAINLGLFGGIENGMLTGSLALSLVGTGFANVLAGNGNANAIDGLDGNDTISGGLGNDAITGGTGADLLAGGAGADTFFFTAMAQMGLTPDATDVISDFRQGQDRIELSQIDASSLLAGDNAFAFVTAIGTAARGEVAVTQFDLAGTANDYTLVMIDTDADRAAEGVIRLKGLIALGAGDFLL